MFYNLIIRLVCENTNIIFYSTRHLFLTLENPLWIFFAPIYKTFQNNNLTHFSKNILASILWQNLNKYINNLFSVLIKIVCRNKDVLV